MFADYPSLNGQYTVIGEVVSGMDVVDKIKKGRAASRRSRPRSSRMQVAADAKMSVPQPRIAASGALAAGSACRRPAAPARRAAGRRRAICYGPTRPVRPNLLYPPGQDLRLTVQSRRRATGAANDRRRLNTLRDLFAALRACWHRRPSEDARPGMEIAMRLSFNRNGEHYRRAALHLHDAGRHDRRSARLYRRRRRRQPGTLHAAAAHRRAWRRDRRPPARHPLYRQQKHHEGA